MSNSTGGKKARIILLPKDVYFLSREEIVDLVFNVEIPRPPDMQKPPTYANEASPTEDEFRKMHTYLSSSQVREWLDFDTNRGTISREIKQNIHEKIESGEIRLFNPMTKQPGYYSLLDGVIIRSDFIRLASERGIDVVATDEIIAKEGQEIQTPESADLWWQTDYKIMELAQRYGDELMAKNKKKPSQNDVAKKVEGHINKKESLKAGIGQKPRHISTTTLKKGPMKGWAYTPKE